MRGQQNVAPGPSRCHDEPMVTPSTKRCVYEYTIAADIYEEALDRLVAVAIGGRGTNAMRKELYKVVKATQEMNRCIAELGQKD